MDSHWLKMGHVSTVETDGNFIFYRLALRSMEEVIEHMKFASKNFGKRLEKLVVVEMA